MLKGKHLIDPMDFSVEEFDKIFELADQIISNPGAFSHVCEGKLLATLFYEPSTRTRFSFEAAMLRLGGKVLGFSEPNSSSAAKGESVADTIRTVACYSDIAVIRHPMEGAPKVASMYSSIPVINAGDGGHQHPTQTLTDLLTIKNLKKSFENHTIGLCGDLKFGRTTHSLVKALSRYKGNKFVLISPEELRIPDYIKKEILEKHNIEFEEAERLEDVIDKLDILYMTRVQRERFTNVEDYLRLKDSYILDSDKLRNAKKDMIILHPLPRVNEIAYEVDEDVRAHYFDQAKYGMFVRMALIVNLLGLNLSEAAFDKDEDTVKRTGTKIKAIKNEFRKCTNSKCITSIEENIPQSFYSSNGEKNTCRCSYCDHEYKIQAGGDFNGAIDKECENNRLISGF
ncbi:aspartate carbamoyltransferase [Clostridiales bacterium oral taxon 876 str. F0540]|nr:aspartate carbamoyltransferase [Clostridiales bacterium oral taxon 876 str. F0540]